RPTHGLHRPLHMRRRGLVTHPDRRRSRAQETPDEMRHGAEGGAGMIDTTTAEQMRADLTWLADHWAQLEHELAGGGGNALTGMPRGESSPLPINIAVSDLMAEIDWRIGSHYCHALLDET